MVAPMPSQRVDPRRDIQRYLGPGEHVLRASRRHIVVLDPAVAMWIAAAILGLTAVLASPRYPGWYLGQLGGGVVLAGTLFLGWKAWEWSITRYVFTNDRVLLIEGMLSRQVRGLPLKAVLDTTYHRTLGGRLRGYGDLELNLSGRPGLRKLTSLPQPETIYHLILSLISGIDPDREEVVDLHEWQGDQLSTG
jgi:hypothetical protein